MALILLGDGVLKFWVQKSLPEMIFSSPLYPYGGIGIFPNLLGIEFSIVHATNPGAAWSLFSDYTIALLIVRIVLITFLIYYFFKESSLRLKTAIALIIAGALGNILDIFFYGHVVDMFHFVFWGYHYPVFNLADSAICIGVAAYLIFSRPLSHDSKKSTS